MVVDGNRFMRRVHIFIKALQKNSYPNAVSLAEQCKCSKNTAQRVIYRLRDEYLIPIEYDSSEKGYYLTQPDYVFPTALPPGKDELTALLLARDLVGMLEDETLTKCMDSLWDQYSTSNPNIGRDLEPIGEVFSSDSSSVAHIADSGVLQYVTDAGVGQDAEIIYESPWSGAGEKKFLGRIEKVHYTDGTLYLLFLESKGRWLTLNSSFIKSYTPLKETVQIGDGDTPISKMEGAENWLEGFGVWTGEDLDQVEIRIKAPASKYYATQQWHASQEDSWDGEVLVRKIKAHVSPEIVRRVLSLGKYVESVSPESLRSAVKEQVEILSAAI